MVNDKSFKTQMTELISKLKTINSKRKIADQPIISVSDILSWKMSLFKSDNEEVIESFAYLTPKNLKHLETRLLIPNQCSHNLVLPTAPNSAQSTQNITYPLAGIQAPNNAPNQMSQQLRIVPPGSTQHQQAIPILVNVQPVNWFLYKYVNGNLDTVYYLPFIN